MGTPAPQIYTLSLHDALPISALATPAVGIDGHVADLARDVRGPAIDLSPEHDSAADARADRDRKSTRLNSSHSSISYAVLCLKKKTTRTPIRCASCRDRDPRC